MEWYYRRGDERGGPVEHDALCTMVAEGAMPLEAKVWREGFRQFIPAATLSGFREIIEPTERRAPGADGAPLIAVMEDPWSPPPGWEPEPEPATARSDESTGAPPAFAGGQILHERSGYNPTDGELQVRPWVRFWARSTDFLIFWVAVLLAWPQLLLLPIIGWHLLYIPLGMLVYDTVFLACFGTTPGKLLFGVKVRTAEGKRLSFGQALSRSFDVLLRGQALGFPVAVFFAQIVAWGVLSAEGSTTWDLRGNYVVRHARIGLIRLVLALIIFPYGLLIVGSTVIALRPAWAPHLAAAMAARPGILGLPGGKPPVPVRIAPAPIRPSAPARKAPPKKLVL